MSRRKVAKRRLWRSQRPFPGCEFLGEAPSTPSSPRAGRECGSARLAESTKAQTSLVKAFLPSCGRPPGSSPSRPRGHPAPQEMGRDTHSVLFLPFTVEA